jgi:hypothetical protein
MAKKTQTAPVTEFTYVVLAGANPATWVGSPSDTRTTDPLQAATFTDEGTALALAKSMRGTVQVRRPVAAEAPAEKPKRTRKPMVQRTEPEAKPAAAPKAPKGPSHQEVVELLKSTGLPVTEKSSSHYGDPKSCRLVLPRSNTVTRVFLYKMPDATTLPGYKTPEERKAQGLGAVTHVCDVSTMEQVRELVAAVCLANGLKAPKAPAKRMRTKKATPVQGTPVTEAQQEPATEQQAEVQ